MVILFANNNVRKESIRTEREYPSMSLVKCYDNASD